MNQDVNKDISIVQISPAWSTVAYHRMTGSFVISMAPAGERLGGSLEISHAAAHSLCEALGAALKDISFALREDM